MGPFLEPVAIGRAIPVADGATSKLFARSARAHVGLDAAGACSPPWPRMSRPLQRLTDAVDDTPGGARRTDRRPGHGLHYLAFSGARGGSPIEGAGTAMSRRQYGDENRCPWHLLVRRAGGGVPLPSPARLVARAELDTFVELHDAAGVLTPAAFCCGDLASRPGRR